ncbi:hypothetical protein Pmani_014817 [Petrolisthes manimaculis]|uniref:PIH1D1/2/3 CS-like domain-containing protein n=1 Tax=Petrolisthes manimaculis TaxID=1843537 RepID=A0AAE1PT85_9EUCA|nr:hypothetical protein Pmani_014817 [Petrolisthes manimaculis]
MERVDVRALASLLYSAEDDNDDSDDETKTPHTGTTSPADLSCSSSTSQVRGSTMSIKVTNSAEETWDDDDGEEQKTDPRPRPEYEVNYRQRVTANQIFLPMSLGGPEEDLVVKIELPGVLFTQVTLEVTSDTLILASPVHYLHLPLPRPVDQRKGVATWDPTTHTLVVTLPTVTRPIV